MNKPNILLITTDTQRCDTLSFMGNACAVSPHLDRLAAEGVWFDNAYTSSPVCSPARTSLMTGVHAPVHGCTENGIVPRQGLPMLPDLLQREGYRTIMAGKTHYGPIPKSFDVVHRTGEKKQNIDDAYGVYIKPLGYSRATSVPNPVPEELCQDAFIVDKTIEEMERSLREDAGRPFFAFCSLVSPHAPFDPPGSWASVYDGVPLPPIVYREGEAARQPELFRRLIGLYGEKEERLRRLLETAEGRQQVDAERRLYYGLAAYCDAQVGRVLDFLDRRKLRERTLVIFTSDHGTTLYDHGVNDKHNYYDSSWRIPLILSMPGTLPQGEKRGFAVWHDLAATILAAAGASCPSMQSVNLFTPLSRGEPSPRTSAVATLYGSAAAVTRRWKLEYYFDAGTGRLFDRQTDPFEFEDVYHRPEYERIRNRLVTALLTWHAGLRDWHYLKTHRTNSPEGHVAKQVCSMIEEGDGLRNERLVNERLSAADMLEPEPVAETFVGEQ